MFRFQACGLATMLFLAVVAVNAPGWLGAGSNFQKFSAPPYIRLAGIMFTTPPEENTQRFCPVAVFPVVGSKTIPFCNCAVPPSVVQTLMGFPLASKSGEPR